MSDNKIKETLKKTDYIFKTKFKFSTQKCEMYIQPITPFIYAFYYTVSL